MASSRATDTQPSSSFKKLSKLLGIPFTTETTDTQEKDKAGIYDSYDINNLSKAIIYLCDLQKQNLPYADVWVTACLGPDLKVLGDEASQQLFALGGASLHNEIQEYSSTRKMPLEVGTVLQTLPGNLPCKQAFHVILNENVITPWSHCPFKSAFAQCMDQLRTTGAESIAFSLFTSQEMSDYDNFVEAMVEAVVSPHILMKKVLFVSHHPVIVRHVSSQLHTALSDKVLAASCLFVPGSTYAVENGPDIQLFEGDILYTTADSMIISTNSSFRKYGLGGHIYGNGGPELRKQFEDIVETNDQPIGSAFTLTGGRLSCKHVIVAVVPSNSDDGEILLPTALSNSLQCAERVGSRTIALPILGRNFSGFDNNHHCQILVDALVTYFQENLSSCIKNVNFVELGTHGALNKALQNHEDISKITETPAEILARGPAALEAYIKASQDGTKSVYRTRLMLVGQERVGKTSLMKNITGQKFNLSESITDGVDASTRCEVAGNSNEPWLIQLTAKTDLADHVQTQYMDTLCELMVQSLTELSQENKELLNDEQLAARDSPQSIGVQKESLDETQMRDSIQGQQIDTEPSSRQMDDTPKLTKEKEHETQPATKQDAVAGVLLEKILERLRKRQSENELEDTDKESRVQEFQIWDFAGQDVYYTTHQVFLSNRAIYIVTFDLCHDLTKPVKIQIPSAEMVQSRFHELTGLRFLDFWMQSIYAYATTDQHQPDEKRPQLSPPIFIVGTHRESSDISKDPNDRKQLIEAKFQSINDMIAGKPYEEHVVSRYYAIENSSTDKEDHELSLLKKHIVSVANQEPYMGEQIPLRWLTFEKSLAEAINEDKHCVDLKQVKDMAKDLGIKSDTEMFTLLHFYHDLGTIIYFGGDDCSNSYLQDMVILDPQWLIDVFKRIITVIPHQKQWATLKKKWRRLKEEGILEDCLIDHMWHNLMPQKPALLALMEMFDLLCPRIHADEEGLDVQTYYVPACLQPCSEEDTQLQMTGERKQTTFYIDFYGFLPDGLFHRLMVHAARWSQQQSGEEPKLFHRYGNFCINDEHSFELQMLTTKPLCIKVKISITPVLSPCESEEDSSLVQPSHMVCDSVKTFLTQTLQELTTTWIHGIRYEFSVACPCNDLQQPPQPHVSSSFHLLPLEECLNKTKIKCKEKNFLIPTEVFKMWFQGVAAEETPGKKGTTFSDVELLQLAEEIGIHWDVLAIYLGLKKCHVDALNSDYPLTVNKAFNMLVQWRQGLTKMADARQLLKKALKKCKLMNLVAKINQ